MAKQLHRGTQRLQPAKPTAPVKLSRWEQTWTPNWDDPNRALKAEQEAQKYRNVIPRGNGGIVRRSK